MENQTTPAPAPVRPWYRLASLARLESLARATSPTLGPAASAPARAPAATPTAAPTITPPVPTTPTSVITAPVPTPPTSMPAAPTARTADPVPAPIPTPTPTSMAVATVAETTESAPLPTSTSVAPVPTVQTNDTVPPPSAPTSVIAAPAALPTPTSIIAASVDQPAPNSMTAAAVSLPALATVTPVQEETAPQPIETPTPSTALLRTLTEQLQALQQPPSPPRNTNGTPLQSPQPQSPRFRAPLRESTPPESPKVIKQTSSTAPESPKIRQLAPIKAPPPPYPEPEPKPLQSPPRDGNASLKTTSDINGNMPPPPSPLVNHQRTRSASPKNATTHNAQNNKHETGEMKMVTMTGENMGAYMELGSHHGQHDSKKHQQHGYHLVPNQNKGSESQNEEGSSDDKKKDKGNKPKPMMAVVNSNVQSVNNSFLFGSSCTQKSPGVHAAIVSKRQSKRK